MKLKDYEIETARMLCEDDQRFTTFSDLALVELWQSWSSIVYSARHMDCDAHRIVQFKIWVFRK